MQIVFCSLYILLSEKEIGPTFRSTVDAGIPWSSRNCAALWVAMIIRRSCQAESNRLV